MELFRNIRLKIGKAMLNKRFARSNRKMIYNNFKQIRSIGIVWNASNNEEFQFLARFHQKMAEKNIIVSILGYFQGKNLPDQYTAIRYLTCIRNKEINIYYIPESPEVKSFINKKIDILIDINFEKLFPLIYITMLSNASFKVGLSDIDDINTPFDLMLEIKKPVSIDNYLNQAIQYLEMINS